MLDNETFITPLINPETINNIYDKKFKCEICNYHTNYKNTFNKHMKSMKHCNKANNQCFNCNICSISFKSRSSLWRHKKNCFLQSETKTKNEYSEKCIETLKNETKGDETILIKPKKILNKPKLKLIIEEEEKKDFLYINLLFNDDDTKYIIYIGFFLYIVYFYSVLNYIIF